MKESTRGVLLSGLVYPGLGQLVLGRVFSGIFLMLFTTAGLFVLIYHIIQRAARGIDEVLSLPAKNELDFNTLKEILSRDFGGGWGPETFSLIGIAGCWLAAIVHAYFVCKKTDSSRQRPEVRKQKTDDKRHTVL